jgi:hypothetical protein
VKGNGDSGHDNLKWEYEEVSQNFRLLAEIRFKLLAFIPPLGGVAIYLLSHLAERSESGVQLLLALISGAGFLVTLGLTSYDQRNSELYDGLLARAKFLEGELKLKANPSARVDIANANSNARGQFRERPPREKKLFGLIRLGHDNGLALIYGSVLGAWFFPLIVTLLAGLGLQATLRFAIGAGVAAVMVIVFVAELLRLDPGKKRPQVTEMESRREGG